MIAAMFIKEWATILVLVILTIGCLFLIWKNRFNVNKITKLIISSLIIFTFNTCLIFSFEPFNSYKNVKVFNNMNEDGFGKRLKVHFLNVGQGDCILIEQGKHYMLIDAGKESDEKKIANYLKDVGIEKFDYVVGTHAHDDHIGSLDYIVKNYEVDTVFMPFVKNTEDKDYNNLLKACDEKDLMITTIKKGEEFKFGNAYCKVLAPANSDYKEINDYSIVIKMTFGDISFLLTGDAQVVSEGEMVSSDENLKSDVLKVGHHGIPTSSSEGFLEKVMPRYAVISVEGDSNYADVISRLQKRNAKVYCTNLKGDIIAETDGKEILFKTEK